MLPHSPSCASQWLREEAGHLFRHEELLAAGCMLLADRLQMNAASGTVPALCTSQKELSHCVCMAGLPPPVVLVDDGVILGLHERIKALQHNLSVMQREAQYQVMCPCNKAVPQQSMLHTTACRQQQCSAGL